MRLLCVIPARIGSTRLSQKPLRRIAGIPLIRLVTERVLELGLDAQVVVAADDRRILAAIRGLPVEAALTDPRHRSGTERVAEVAARSTYAQYDVVVNVQGDEPFVAAAAVTGAVQRVCQGDPVGTAAAPLSVARRNDPHCVKVFLDKTGHAAGFSRTVTDVGEGMTSWQHVGIYAYEREALFRWVAAAPVAEEQAVRLEQLRPLALGMPIGVTTLEEDALPGIDTEADIQFAEEYLSSAQVAGIGNDTGEGLE